MPAFYNAIDVFCLSSQQEGLPLSLLEAQACEKPVVTTDAGSCQEAVDKDSGKIVPIGSLDKLASALEQQIKTGITPQARKAARQFIKKHFELQLMIDGYHRIYQETV